MPYSKQSIFLTNFTSLQLTGEANPHKNKVNGDRPCMKSHDTFVCKYDVSDSSHLNEMLEMIKRRTFFFKHLNNIHLEYINLFRRVVSVVLFSP